MKVLITGGAGYIGSTVASACEDAGHEVVILDDFSTGRREFIGNRAVYEGDFADEALLERVFSDHAIDAVVHCAAKIVVPESVEQPLDYYENNVSKTITLLRAMERAGVLRFLFSSSASIYAPDENFIVTEDSPLSPGSPYARTKYIVEMILEDFTRASAMKVLSLRYFNPIGTDPKLRSGQQLEKPSHVLAKLLEAWSKGETFTVTGVDWPTRDGSGIRDFIHVWDLAQAHVAALEGFDKATANSSYEVFNIGRGRRLHRLVEGQGRSGLGGEADRAGGRSRRHRLAARPQGDARLLRSADVLALGPDGVHMRSYGSTARKLRRSRPPHRLAPRGSRP